MTRKKKKKSSRSEKREDRKDARQDRREDRKDNRQERRSDRKENRAERKDDRQENRADRKENRQENRAERKENRAERQENRQDRREDRKEARQERREDRQDRREERREKGVIKSVVDEVGERIRRNEVRVWKVDDKYRQKFPENDHPEWGGRPEIGVCFSGGGTRSATASLGQMRALKELGLDKHIDIMGAISGGGWFATPYTYLPKSVKESKFLGEHVNPADCDKKYLNTGSRKENIFAHSLSRTDILFKPWAWGTVAWNAALSVFQFRNKRDDESWGKIVGKSFLDPIDRYHARQRFLCGTADDRRKIIKRNGHLETDDFDVVERKRPFLVLGGAIINWNAIAKAQAAFGKKGAPIYPIEITPLYSGSNCHYDGKETAGGAEFGGGYIDPLGFDTPAPSGKIDTPTVKVRTRKVYNRLSVQDAMATTGAAPAYYAVQASTLSSIALGWAPPLKGLVKIITKALPEYLHWDIERNERAKDRNRQFGDGGFADNLGLIPLLKRGTKKVVVFVNSQDKLDLGGQGIYEGIQLMFGEEDKNDKSILARNRNHVLETASDPKEGTFGYRDTVKGLKTAKKNGGPIVFSGKYKVKKNSWHGVKGGYEVEIAWVYLDCPQNWLKELNNQTKTEELSKDDYENFPNYKTFFPNGDRKDVIDLTLPQVQLMSNLTGWTVIQARKEGLLDNIFGEVAGRGEHSGRKGGSRRRSGSRS